VRIGLLGPAYPFRGGIAHYTTLLYRALAVRHEVRFVSFSRQYPRWLFPGRTDRDESSAPLRAEGAEPVLDPLNMRSWWRAGDRLAAFEPNLTILPWWTPFWTVPYAAVLARLRRAGCGRALFLCHNVSGHEGDLAHRWAVCSCGKDRPLSFIRSRRPPPWRPWCPGPPCAGRHTPAMPS